MELNQRVISLEKTEEKTKAKGPDLGLSGLACSKTPREPHHARARVWEREGSRGASGSAMDSRGVFFLTRSCMHAWVHTRERRGAGAHLRGLPGLGEVMMTMWRDEAVATE